MASLSQMVVLRLDCARLVAADLLAKLAEVNSRGSNDAPVVRMNRGFPVRKNNSQEFSSQRSGIAFSLRGYQCRTHRMMTLSFM